MTTTLDLSRCLGDTSTSGGLILSLANLLRDQGRFEEAHALFTEALEIFRSESNQSSVVACLRELGEIARRQGQFEEARKLNNEALDAAGVADDQSELAYVLNNLGNVADVQGRFDEAHKFYTEALEIFRKVGDQSGVATVLYHLGILARQHGHLKKAIELQMAAAVGCIRQVNPLQDQALQELSNLRIDLGTDAFQAQALSIASTLPEPSFLMNHNAWTDAVNRSYRQVAEADPLF